MTTTSFYSKKGRANMKGRFQKPTIVIVIWVTVTASASANADMVAHWELDETGGTVVRDSSANGHHGKVVEGTPIWDSDGKYGGCLNFDGTYGVSVPSGVFSNVGEAITVSVWVNGDADQNNVTNVILQAGVDKEDGHHFLVSIYADWQDGSVELATGYDNENSEEWEDAQPGDWAGAWNHWVFVTNIDERFQGVYHNGHLMCDGGADKWMAGVTKANIGMATDRVQGHYIGKLDDIRVYNRALSADEIAQLYKFSPVPQILMAAVAEAEAILDEQEPQEAIVFLETKIAELEQCKREKPDTYVPCFKGLSFDLNFSLAKAKQAAGLPKKDVEAAYNRAFKQGIPSLSYCASVLLHLYENGNTEEFGRIARSLNENHRDYLKEVAVKAQEMVFTGKSKAAIGFLESTLDGHAQWREKHPNDSTVAGGLPTIYFQLAKAKEAAGASAEDVAAAFVKTFGPSHEHHVPERAAALVWLLENERSDEYTEVIKSFTQSRDVKGSFTNVVRDVCRNLESEKMWAPFKLFLDTLLAEAKSPFEWAMFVESCLKGKTSRWAKEYSEYFNGNPRLKFRRDCWVAEKYLVDEDFEKAAELYGDVVNRCGPEDDKGFLEFQRCKCLFYAAGHPKAGPQLAGFIANYKASHANLAREAMLMKGRLHIDADEMDKAVEEFLAVTAEYPETKQACEAQFFLGYCHMRQNEHEKAVEAFDRVTREYPESGLASKAHLCLAKIRNKIEEGAVE